MAFGFLGAVDDLLGDADDRGLRGHLVAAAHGWVTTGFVKLGGGVAVSLMLAGAADGDHAGRVLLDAGFIALAANLANLLDLAPGRTIKWALLAYVPLAIVAGSAAVGMAMGVVAGAALALLPGRYAASISCSATPGPTPLGAALGVGTVLSTSPGTRTTVAIVLLLLTLVSEVVSFSRHHRTACRPCVASTSSADAAWGPDDAARSSGCPAPRRAGRAGRTAPARRRSGGRHRPRPRPPWWRPPGPGVCSSSRSLG